MGTRTRYEPGTFCWVDVDSPDPDAAARFYGALLGWTVQDAREDADYHLFTLAGATVAGLDPLSEEEFAAGGRPAWNTYVAVEDAAAVAARATELGGAVVDDVREVQDAGCAVCIADPDGATLWLWQPSTFPGAAVVNEVGAWAWNDLQTPDPEAASRFYSSLFGWEITEVPGSGGAYRTIRSGGRAIGGVMTADPGAKTPAWAVYFGVASVGAALEHVDAADGERLTDAVDVPGGRFAIASDPFGATFGVFEGRFDA
jgi:predicted enzyme related to lactoylglutathione lyase